MSQLTLPPSIDTATVAGLRSDILELRGADLEIDASNIQRIGGLGLQVLLSASRVWAAENLRFAVVRASPAMSEAARLMGVAHFAESVK